MFDDSSYWFKVMLLAIGWIIAFGGVVFSLLYLNYFFISLPLRRRERARLFLDLIETGVQQGRSAGQTIVSISDTRDQSVGVWFHLLAGYLEQGLPLGEALARVPQLVPAKMAAMLKAGETVGDLRKVLPACRQLLADAPSQSRASLNFLMVGPVLGFPAGILVLGFVFWRVFPMFWDLYLNMGLLPSPLFVFLKQHQLVLMESQIALLLAAWSAVFLFIGGGRFLSRFFPGSQAVAGYLTYRLPWCRKRMQRDFSTMLAILLDSGVPEPEALKLAAACAANVIFTNRAEKALAGLSRGMPLSEAVQLMDDAGEFKWRMAQAIESRGGFVRALAAWNGALDAKAFQLEQGAAHVLSTGLVLLNGLLVGAIAVGVFQGLAGLINTEVAW